MHVRTRRRQEMCEMEVFGRRSWRTAERMERKSKMEAGDNDDGDDGGDGGDFGCLLGEFSSFQPSDYKTTAAEHNVSRCNEIN